MLPKETYAIALSVAFEYRNGIATKHVVISDRLNSLEKYCYQMRLKK